MPGLPLPSSTGDPMALADWVELHALRSADLNASWGDLYAALQMEGLQPVESACTRTFDELWLRASAAADAYPFHVTGNYIQCTDDWRQYPEYVFCLCLSYFGAPDRSQRPPEHPRRLFEHLATHAAGAYLGEGGAAVRFGAPRDAAVFPSNFMAAVAKVCGTSMMGEGSPRARRNACRAKDDGVDVIAWRDFPDRAEGKLLLFGNCASGRDWRQKVFELSPRTFCNKWISPEPPSKILRSMFSPHRVPRDEWCDRISEVGLLFDRCRLAYWAHRRAWAPPASPHLRAIRTWAQTTVQNADATV